MKYPQSEIFESYAKLALDKGLISAEHKSLPSKLAEETNPRYDSQDISTIEALYGVKPTGESEKDILDQAHPESVVIAPSYDKLNGLVENLKERHNIMVGIALKPTNGLITQHAYVTARSKLLDELLKVGFLLDRENKTELMSLADSCSERLVKIANPFLIAALITSGIATIYTAISQNMHLSQGVSQDAEKALVELQEAISSYSETGDLKNELGGLIDKIKLLKEAAIKVASVKINPVTEGQSQAALAAYSALQEGKDKEAISLMAGFSSGCVDMVTLLDRYIPILKTKSAQVEPSHSDFIEPLRRAFRTIIPSDIDDAIGALEALKKSCQAAPAQIEAMIELFRELRTKGVESTEEFKKRLEGKDIGSEEQNELMPKPKPMVV